MDGFAAAPLLIPLEGRARPKVKSTQCCGSDSCCLCVSQFRSNPCKISDMPPLPPLANAIRSRLLWSDGSDANVSSTLFWRYTGGPPSAADVSALAQDLYTAAAGFDGLYPADTQLTGTEITDLSSSSGFQAEHNQTTAGIRAGTPLAGGTAVVVGYNIGRRYRGGKPRNYFPWGTANDLQTRQLWTNSFITDIQTAFSSFAGSFIGAASGGTTIAAHINVSYYEGFTTPTPAPGKRAKNVSTPRVTPLPNDIVSFTVRTAPGSQRRRNV